MKPMHAHIYFQSSDLEVSQILYRELSRNPLFVFHETYEKATGPHPRPMIEVHFLAENLDHVKEFFQRKLGPFSILLHHDTGDDVRDHIEDICWLGPKLALDFSFFELIKTRPELKVHPE